MSLLKSVLKIVCRMWIGMIWLSVGIQGRVLVEDNESSVSVKGEEFLDWLRHY
jgi:hypothetical protein